MLYKYRKQTQSHRKGERVQYNPNSMRAKELVRLGIIEAVEPPAMSRETKVIEPEETKQEPAPKPKRKRKKKAVTDEPSADE